MTTQTPVSTIQLDKMTRAQYNALETKDTNHFYVITDEEQTSTPLPSQVGNAGKFLSTNGTEMSWSIIMNNVATQDSSIGIISTTSTTHNITGNNCVGIGNNIQATADNTVAIGNGAQATAEGAVQIGNGINNTENTVKVNNYQLLDSNGNISLDRLQNFIQVVDELPEVIEDNIIYMITD